MKKKTFILFITIVSLLVISVIFFGSARPIYSQTGHAGSTCHESPGVYTISYTTPVKSEINNKSYYVFNVTATGLNLFVHTYPDAKDNDDFNIMPSNDRIVDGSGDDFDPNPNAMTVVFNVTPTVEKDSYTLFIIAGNNLTGGQIFDYAEIIIGPPPAVDLLSKIFNHLGIYLGLPALLLVSLGTVLVLINENKFVKVHGILAGASWILTVVNIAIAIIDIPIVSWFGVWPPIYHIPHIILGATGLISGFFSMLFGIAAERKPALITGYITLVSWWAAFLLGYFLNNDLLLLLT